MLRHLIRFHMGKVLIHECRDQCGGLARKHGAQDPEEMRFRYQHQSAVALPDAALLEHPGELLGKRLGDVRCKSHLLLEGVPGAVDVEAAARLVRSEVLALSRPWGCGMSWSRLRPLPGPLFSKTRAPPRWAI